MQYQLKIQQLVTYAKSRVYRNFIRALSDNENIRLNGESNLFYFMTLCSYANFRTSTFRIDAMRYTLAPGEWMMPVRELMEIYRKKTEKGTVAALERLQQSNHIRYELLHHRRYVKFRINNWSKFNSTIEATAPCGFGCSPNTGRTSGFFFFPYKMVSEFIGKGKCSEMDILLDLWLNAIYNDERIAGSDVGPVVYYRNGTHSPLTGYEDLGKRWGISKSTAGRIPRKLEGNSYIKLVAFPGKYRTAIYLQNYLSTMFNISDITIDKEEVALSLNIRINIPDETTENTIEMIEELLDSACQNCENSITDDQISVPETVGCVPESHLRKIVRKTAKVLFLQGLRKTNMARKKITQDAHYHDTLLLLKKYRDVVWSLTVAVEQAKNDFRECYGSSVDEFLESIYVAGADLSGTDIEERAKSIERSNKMLKFVDHAVQIMREKNKNGEVFYQVLYFNYLSPYESASNEDVTQALGDAGYPMCRKTMTEYRSLAVDCVSSILWGFSARDCREILDRFVQE